MLEIRITDPHTMDPDAVRKIAAILIELVKDIPEPKGTDTTDTRLFKPEPELPPLGLAPIPPKPSKPYVSEPPAKPTHNPFKPIVDTTPIIEEEFTPVPAEEIHINTVGNATSLELDARGFPWDNRIHSGNRSFNTDGSWRYMRKIDKDTIAMVEEQLRQALSAPVAPRFIERKNDKPVPPPPPLPSTNDFAAFMRKMSEAVASGRVHHAQILEIVKAFGIPSVALVGTRVDLIPAILLRIDELLGN